MNININRFVPIVAAAIALLSLTAVHAVEEMEVGPYVQFTDPATAVIRWDTDTPRNSVVKYGTAPGSLTTRVEDPTPKTTHEITLNNIHLKDKYFYAVGYTSGTDRMTSEFWFDNAINYSRIDVSGAISPYTPDALTSVYEAAADRIIAQTGIKKGICLVYGCGQGRLAFELAKRTDLMIVGVDTDQGNIDTAAEKLMEAGLYGSRVTVRKVDSLNSLPFTKYLANLIVSDAMITGSTCPGDADEMFRVLRPSGGVAYLGRPSGTLTEATLRNWLDAAGLSYTVDTAGGTLWAEVVKPEVSGAGWWTHQYGGPENNGNANDTLEGAVRTTDMDLQWISYPGADSGIDRMVRMQGPVAKNGKLVHLGFNKIITMDSYNGTILWSLEIPELKRFNIPRDCGYICIDDDNIYVAVKDDCWRLDPDTGIRSLTHKLGDATYDWGCVFRYSDKLYGSAVKEGAFFTTWWGTSAWFDGTSGDPTYKICSDYIFANDLDGNPLWTYDSSDGDKGVIINSTICFGGGRMYFVECRDATVEASSSGRIGLSQLWDSLYIVALDADTGTRLWAKDIISGGGGDAVVAGGTVVFYMMYADENLFIGSSDTSYHLYAYQVSDSSCAYNWKNEFNWSSDNHGWHMDRPIVVGNNVYLERYGYDMDTGAQVTSGAPSGHCGTVAGTANGILHRSGNITMWNTSVGSSSWSSIRQNCWISTIGSGGMVLAPEGGGGCDCYGWFHTSAAFVRSDN